MDRGLIAEVAYGDSPPLGYALAVQSSQDSETTLNGDDSSRFTRREIAETYFLCRMRTPSLRFGSIGYTGESWERSKRPGRVWARGDGMTKIGFLGAGTILRGEGSIFGLTTAATIWAVAALGMLVGAGLYILSVFMVVLVLLVLWGLARLERPSVT